MSIEKLINNLVENNELKCEDSVKAQLVGIEEDYVVMKCLMDDENLIFENRTFEKSALTGKLKCGQFYNIQIYVGSNIKILKFNPASEDYKEFFEEPEDFFGDIRYDDLFKPAK